MSVLCQFYVSSVYAPRVAPVWTRPFPSHVRLAVGAGDCDELAHELAMELAEEFFDMGMCVYKIDSE